MKSAVKSVLVPSTIALLAACRSTPPASTPSPERAASTPSFDHAELARLCEEDQGDRRPHEGPPIDGKLIVARDNVREARVKELYRAGELHTGLDYHHAALILQHAHEPEDYLLAHELCIVAVAKGDATAMWLCAATEDRFLMNIGRPQRFATQYKADRGEPMHLYVVGDGVTDALRAEFKAPPLEAAKQREAQYSSRSGKTP
jgi:hypothetical protein